MTEPLRIDLLPAGALWEAEVWRGPDGARLCKAFEAPAPAPGEWVEAASGARLWRRAPLVWRVWTGADPAAPPPAPLAELDAEAGAAAEIGAGLARLRIAGDWQAVAALLARLVPLDLRPAAFPEGAVAVTGWRHVPLTLLREPGAAALLVPLSLAPALETQARRVAARLTAV
ncbi:MAG: hypothetical protein VYD87_07030 [Pseudomonadota bacterium]|nr:hypothetical protein [Pseudomonadota bacterium]MEE3101560.1 hypothetical protein [Pseudomonadota bacterium]